MSKSAKKIIKLSKKKQTPERIEKVGKHAKKIMDKRKKKYGDQLLPESKGTEMTELEQYIEKMIAEGFSDAEIAHMIELDEELSKLAESVKERFKNIAAGAASGAFMGGVGTGNWKGAVAGAIGGTIAITALELRDAIKRRGDKKRQKAWLNMNANMKKTGSPVKEQRERLTQDDRERIGATKAAERDGHDLPNQMSKELKDKLKRARERAKSIGLKSEEIELEEQRAGKVKLTPGKKMTSAQFKKAKLEAAAKKKAKEAPKKEAPKEQQETTGLDKILSSHDNRTIQQIKNIMKSIKSPDHRDAVMKSLVSNPSKSNVMALIRDPIEFVKSTTAKAKKGQPSLSKLKFMGENP